MREDKSKKVINVILYLLSVVVVLGILIGLIVFVYNFNDNYRKYEFKLESNAISIQLGQYGDVPIVSIDGESVNLDDYTYTATDNSIIKVTEDGKIIGNKVGTTAVVVKAKKSNQKEILNVNVVLKGEGLVLQDININVTDVSLKVGEVYTVNYEIIPNGALTNTIIWSSSNTGVATVDNGVITSKGAGNCIIYVKDGSINKEINVKVTN